MRGHYKTVCREHGTVYEQCRCPSPDKTVRQEPCDPRCPLYLLSEDQPPKHLRRPPDA